MFDKLIEDSIVSNLGKLGIWICKTGHDIINIERHEESGSLVNHRFLTTKYIFVQEQKVQYFLKNLGHTKVK